MFECFSVLDFKGRNGSLLLPDAAVSQKQFTTGVEELDNESKKMFCDLKIGIRLGLLTVGVNFSRQHVNAGKMQALNTFRLKIMYDYFGRHYGLPFRVFWGLQPQVLFPFCLSEK